jgi:hypothetical protein
MDRFLQIALGLVNTLGLKLDAGQTGVLARALEYIESKTYEVKYTELKARRFIPVNTSVPPGAQTVTYAQWDYYGLAKVVANYADDIPLVDAVAREYTARIKTLADGYTYSVEDIMAAAMSGSNLPDERAKAARRVIEQGIDEIAAFGLPQAGMPGLLNHPNVPIVAPTTGNWGSATTTQILADLRKLVKAVVTNTKETQPPDTLLLPVDQFEELSMREMAPENPKSVLRVFLENNAHVKNVDSWGKLATASPAAGPRALCYRRDSEVLDLVISQDFTQLPPQAVNLAFKVPCMARTGSTRIRYPLALAYMDGI